MVKKAYTPEEIKKIVKALSKNVKGFFDPMLNFGLD